MCAERGSQSQSLLPHSETIWLFRGINQFILTLSQAEGFSNVGKHICVCNSFRCSAWWTAAYKTIVSVWFFWSMKSIHFHRENHQPHLQKKKISITCVQKHIIKCFPFLHNFLQGNVLELLNAFWKVITGYCLECVDSIKLILRSQLAILTALENESPTDL